MICSVYLVLLDLSRPILLTPGPFRPTSATCCIFDTVELSRTVKVVSIFRTFGDVAQPGGSEVERGLTVRERAHDARAPPDRAGCARAQGPSGASPARSSAHRTPGATDNTSPRSPRSGGLRPPCSGPARPEHRPAATSRRSLQACIASLPLQSSLMSKTYLKSDHFNGGVSFAPPRIGASNILLERWTTAPSVAETVERFKPTVMLSVPAVYHRLLDAGLAPTPAFRALRHYVSAGERLPPQIWSAWEAASGHPILDGLGCSELVYMVIGNTPQRRLPGSSGLTMPSVELRIVDEAGTILAEPGKTGRLEVRMPSVCAGYRAAGDKLDDPPHRPEERFRPDGWFATGDEYLQDPDGFYHHRGRTGDMLRVSGIWISPDEIEDVLAGIRSISETAAVLGQSEIGLAEIVLYVVPAPGADGSAAVAAARERLSRALPPYKQPRRFEIAHDLPRTATGKVQRNKLREQLRRE